MSSRSQIANRRIYGVIGSAIPINGDEIHVPVVSRTPKPKASINSGPRQPKVSNGSNSNTPESCSCGLRDKLVKCQAAEKQSRAKLEIANKEIEKYREEISLALSNYERSLEEAESKHNVQLQLIEQRLAEEISMKIEAVKRHENCDEKLEEMSKLYNSTRSQNDMELERLKKKYEEEMAEVINYRDEQIQIREDRLAKLKTQIADKLTGNSSERQKQIDELLKEMNKLQEEHEVLKAKLKTYGQVKHVKPVCENCTTSNARVKVLEDRLKDRENVVNELKAMCDKFDRQLKQNNHLGSISIELTKSLRK